MPDFANLRKAFLCQGEPDRVPAVEYAVDRVIKAKFLGREQETVDDEAKFFLGAGYDFVPVLFGMRLTLVQRAALASGLFADHDAQQAAFLRQVQIHLRWGSGFRVRGLGFRVQGSGFTVQG